MKKKEKGKKKDKIDHKRPKKKKKRRKQNQKLPPNPHKVMSALSLGFFVCFVLGNNIFLKVALLWSGNLK